MKYIDLPSFPSEAKGKWQIMTQFTSALADEGMRETL